MFKIFHVQALWHNGNQVGMQVGGVVRVDGAHPENGLSEAFFKCLHGLHGNVTHV
jgi:hypothetical protein